MKKQELLEFLPIIPDFPVKGVMFRDISPLCANEKAFASSIQSLARLVRDLDFDYIVGAESRGFIFGAALALKLKKGFIMARKPGKLPTKTLKESYGLEYGSDSLEIEEGLLPQGAKVLLLDDVIATGGTLLATAKLIERAGATVNGIACLLDIAFLEGAKKLEEKGYRVKRVLTI